MPPHAAAAAGAATHVQLPGGTTLSYVNPPCRRWLLNPSKAAPHAQWTIGLLVLGLVRDGSGHLLGEPKGQWARPLLQLVLERLSEPPRAGAEGCRIPDAERGLLALVCDWPWQTLPEQERAALKNPNGQANGGKSCTSTSPDQGKPA